MIVRQARFVGHIHSGAEQGFYDFVRARLVPMWRRFPGLERLEVCFPVSADEGAAPVALSLSMYFPDRAALEETLASSIRIASRGVTQELLTRFEGHVEHHIFEVEGERP